MTDHAWKIYYQEYNQLTSDNFTEILKQEN